MLVPSGQKFIFLTHASTTTSSRVSPWAYFLPSKHAKPLPSSSSINNLALASIKKKKFLSHTQARAIAIAANAAVNFPTLNSSKFQFSKIWGRNGTLGTVRDVGSNEKTPTSAGDGTSGGFSGDVQGSPRQQDKHEAVKLFVFGDSYADTGNSRKPDAVSWKLPYGITFPGKPSGRFSDGCVLTDYIAYFLGIRSPVPYRMRNSVKRSNLGTGMNFAFGGTGVFNTFVNEPNMSTQITLFQELLEQKFYTKQDLKSSIALVSLAGNDYATYVTKQGNNPEELDGLAKSIINQLTENLKRIQSLGVRKIAVTDLHPLGCLPQITAVSSSFKNCSENLNMVSNLHNQILHQQLSNLSSNLQSSQKYGVVILDLYSAFMSAFSNNMQNNHSDQGNLTILKPCCVGTSNKYTCGSTIGEGGEKKYTVCEHPELSFFWDMIHPSQHGWRSVYSALTNTSSLDNLIN